VTRWIEEWHREEIPLLMTNKIKTDDSQCTDSKTHFQTNNKVEKDKESHNYFNLTKFQDPVQSFTFLKLTTPLS